MGNRLSKIYTRTGDDGTTGLGDGSRIEKDHPRVAACGAVDETNSQIGVVVACTQDPDVRAVLIEIQHDLFDLGGELATPGMEVLRDGAAKRLESVLDGYNSDLPPLKDFILPGGGGAAAQCHVARTVCRRAERALVTLHRAAPVRDGLRHYLNRLSDLLFVLARVLARADGESEQLWNHERR